MIRNIIFTSLCFFILLQAAMATPNGWQIQASSTENKQVDQPTETLMNINNISMWIRADGSLSQRPSIDNPSSNHKWSVFYPHGTAGIVYGDGIFWGGMVNDGADPRLRVGGSKYRTGLQPGRIISKGIAEEYDENEQQIWRIRPDWQGVNLHREAVEHFYSEIYAKFKTQAEALDSIDLVFSSMRNDYLEYLNNIPPQYRDSVRYRYEEDWKNWPWQKGAPFYDINKNGIMDEGEKPGFAHADQVVWFVANDLDSSKTNALFSEWDLHYYDPHPGSPPIGLEIQVTYWAYSKSGSRMNDAFSNMIFKRVRLIYKGTSEAPDTARIDSMFIAQFAATDIGQPGDDFAGCDTLLQLGYAYNSITHDNAYDQFDIVAPAVGYTLLQGPKTNSIDDPDNQNFLPMTSFWMQATGTALSNPNSTKKMYKCMNGYLPFPDEHLYPFLDCGDPDILGDGQPTKFMLSGDPVAGSGCIDGMHHVHPGGPGVRSIMMNSGPFSMALGDTQDVYIAIVAGMGSDRNGSISVMKHYVKWAQCWAQDVFKTGLTDFPNDDLAGEGPIPQNFRLYENYPNPFNAETTIRYDLPLQKGVRLTIFNMIGQEINKLVDDVQEAGSHSIRWDGTDAFGNHVPTGVYFIRLYAGHWVVTRKMLLLR